MLIKKSPDIRESEVTPESWYVRRREFLQVAGSTAVAVAAGAAGPLFSGTDTAFAQNPAAQKLDIAITPLAIPMLAGPGAISTVILLHNQTTGVAQNIALCVCILAVSAATYVILRLSATGAKWLNPIALKITTRIMGLLLAAVASQFMINALRELKLVP